MKKEMYTIRDTVSNEMAQPFFQANKKTAIRAFREACNNMPEIKDHAEDMELFFVGTFDTETGLIANEPEMIERGVKNNV